MLRPKWGMEPHQCLFYTETSLSHWHVPLPMINPSHLAQFMTVVLRLPDVLESTKCTPGFVEPGLKVPMK